MLRGGCRGANNKGSANNTESLQSNCHLVQPALVCCIFLRFESRCNADEFAPQMAPQAAPLQQLQYPRSVPNDFVCAALMTISLEPTIFVVARTDTTVSARGAALFVTSAFSS